VERKTAWRGKGNRELHPPPHSPQPARASPLVQSGSSASAQRGCPSSSLLHAQRRKSSSLVREQLRKAAHPPQPARAGRAQRVQDGMSGEGGVEQGVPILVREQLRSGPIVPSPLAGSMATTHGSSAVSPVPLLPLSPHPHPHSAIRRSCVRCVSEPRALKGGGYRPKEGKQR
jgi:hypothetical protein